MDGTIVSRDREKPRLDEKTKKIRDADIIISTIFVVGSGWTAFESLRIGDLKFLFPTALKKTFSGLQAFTPTIIMGMLCTYVFILVERIPFTIATFVFVTLLMTIFKATRIHWIIVIGALYSVAIVYFFTTVVGTQFPISLFF